jgi:hypothetical protein
MPKKTKWRLTLTEPQLRLISQCVEDCSRFASGQTEMGNTIGYLHNSSSIRDVLRTVKPIVTPGLEPNASYGWNGGSCPRKLQRGFIAKTYYLYREILHCLTVERNKEEDMSWNVHLGETLRCADSGEPIKLEVVNETDKD